MKIEIKCSWSENMHFEHKREENTMRITAEAAVKDGADMDGANLRGATYGIAARAKGTKILLGEIWPIYFFDAHIKIGSKMFSTAEWENFTDEEISQMDSRALDWWKKKKHIILAIAKDHQGE